jgi:hypothetical protein
VHPYQRKLGFCRYEYFSVTRARNGGKRHAT